MNFKNRVAWRVARWALSVKVATLLVLTSPGLVMPTSASAHVSVGPLPFIAQMDAAERTLAVSCLADAIYYEAAFEPQEGQQAVAQVVLNRVRDSNFPDTVCGVVYQGWQRKTGCQFSFVCDGSLTRRPPEADQRAHAEGVAMQMLSGVTVQEVGTATHYHTDYVDPYWRPTLVEITQIGQHIFYKWPGKAGQPEALKATYTGDEAEAWAEIRPLRGRVLS
jgi:spore germination cell wall hydrolase CwlJ-like protein